MSSIVEFLFLAGSVSAGSGLNAGRVVDYCGYHYDDVVQYCYRYHHHRHYAEHRH